MFFLRVTECDTTPWVVIHSFSFCYMLFAIWHHVSNHPASFCGFKLRSQEQDWAVRRLWKSSSCDTHWLKKAFPPIHNQKKCKTVNNFIWASQTNTLIGSLCYHNLWSNKMFKALKSCTRFIPWMYYCVYTEEVHLVSCLWALRLTVSGGLIGASDKFV